MEDLLLEALNLCELFSFITTLFVVITLLMLMLSLDFQVIIIQRKTGLGRYCRARPPETKQTVLLSSGGH
jgi:hypothetical protein